MKVNVHPNDFADLVLIFLFDKMVNRDSVLPKNERFNELMNKLSSKGVKAELLPYYMDSPVNLRTKYKMLKDTFIKPQSSTNTINILGGKEEDFDKEKKSKLKGVVRKVMGMIHSGRQKKGFPLTEREVSSIVDNALDREEIEKELLEC